MGGETEVSIEPSAGREKYFSWASGVGFYASGHDRKMTENGAYRQSCLRGGRAGGRGQALEKHRNAVEGVRDSQKRFSALWPTPGPRRRAAA
jgi:hypothetical protein